MNATIGLSSAFLFFCVSLGAQEDLGVANRNAKDISIIELIANAGAFDGDLVRLTGVLNIEFERDLVCLSKEALRYNVTKNCLAVGFDEDSLGLDRATLRGFTGDYVLIEGTFKARDKGHMSMSSASVREVKRLLPWERVMAPDPPGSAGDLED